MKASEMSALFKESNNQFMQRGQQLLKKWNWLLESKDSKDPLMEDTQAAMRNKINMAYMLENQAQFLNSMDEATKATQIGDFAKYIYPLVRRTYPTLAINDLVSVQPLTGPNGLVFYLRFKAGTTKGAVQAGQEYLGDNVSGFNEFYSSDIVDQEQIGTGTGSSAAVTGTLKFLPIYNGSVTVEGTIGGNPVVGNDNGAGSITGDITGTVNYATGAIAITAAAFDAGTPVTVTYRYNNEANEQVAEIDLEILSSPVIATTRKLRTKWSPEAAQDLMNLHGLEAEVELVSLISQHLALEINREVLIDLRRIADSSQNWSKTAPIGVPFKDYKDTFVDSMVAISNQIYAKTLRAVPNFAVASVAASNIIETLPGFVSAGTGSIQGIGFIGTLNSKWKIYKDPFDQTNSCIVGYKGPSFLDTGYVYSPYVPLIATPTLTNPDDFLSRKGLMSRYGKKAINGRYYGILNLVA